MSRNIASMLQPKVLRTNDSSNAVLNNNQVLYNNPTSVAERNSSEKEINDEEQKENRSNDTQSETLRIFENLNSMENVSEPILIFQVVLKLPLENLKLRNNSIN